MTAAGLSAALAAAAPFGNGGGEGPFGTAVAAAYDPAPMDSRAFLGLQRFWQSGLSAGGVK